MSDESWRGKAVAWTLKKWRSSWHPAAHPGRTVRGALRGRARVPVRRGPHGGKPGRRGHLHQRERDAFDIEQRRLQIRAAGPDQGTWQLSGGNQQKIVLAKWLRTQPKVLLLDEPTRGIDVGAKTEIYRIVRELAAAGMAVVVVSSDLPEVTGLAHRVIVCRQGHVVGELSGADIAEEKIMNLALGLSEVPS